MREVNVKLINEKIYEAFSELCFKYEDDTKNKIEKAYETSTGREKKVLELLMENEKEAYEKRVPLCQDTGMAFVFVKLGQEVHITGGSLREAVNEGVRRAYSEGYLRKSVADPLTRVNTGDNTPAIIYFDVVEGDSFEITALPKGFGSENMSRIAMMNPTSGEDDIIRFVTETVKSAGGNPCPPTVIGVGIGGSFDYAAFLAKKALSRPVGVIDDSRESRLEQRILKALNETGVGPQGLGGVTTSLWVNVETYPTHIASLPVAVNVSCHATRHDRTEL